MQELTVRGECGHDKLLTFSCKRRGFYPSCGARRMSQTAAHLVDHVIPHVPVRQWVVALPIPLRVLLAAHPELAVDKLGRARALIAAEQWSAALDELGRVNDIGSAEWNNLMSYTLS